VGVNPIDTKLRADGAFAGYGPGSILGFDVSGEVTALGPGASGFSVGDRVFYTQPVKSGMGAYAQYHCVDCGLAALIPDELGFEDAASLPLAFSTAWGALVTHGGLQPSMRVLVHGGGGGVGSLAVQIAAGAGAFVLATCGHYDRDRVTALGARATVDYRREDFVAVAKSLSGHRGFDLVLDTVGGEVLAKSFACLCPGGRIVTILGTRGADIAGAYRSNVGLFHFFLTPSAAAMEALRRLLLWGLLTPVVGAVLPLSEGARAHRMLAEQGPDLFGKIVLRVDH